MTGSRRALLAVALAALGSCRGAPPAAARSAAPPPPRAILESPSGRATAVRIELARTPAEHERGLMFRRELGPDQGMLFVFPDSRERTFWMQNTLIPLDMIFIDDARTVVGIVADAEPLTTTARAVGLPSRYVLEVNGGFCAAHGIAKGDRVRFEGVPAEPAQ